MLSEKQRKRAFNTIIITQCLGMPVGILFQNGFYLNFFSKLGISSAATATLFALPAFVGAFLILPFAFFADRMGKKRLALAGQVLVIGSLLMMMGAGWGTPGLALPVVIASLTVFCIGGSLQGASWFALLGPIIPKEIRGRFFGRLRVTFMTVCILFTMLITRVLSFSQSMAAFQMLLGVVLVAACVRYVTYSKIPELENAGGDVENRPDFKAAIKSVSAVPGFAQFNSYVFLITLFTAGVPVVFGLMQKDVFDFAPALITRVGIFFLIGSVAGNLLGGRAVDRFGTRAVFLLAHVSYAVVILGMLARHWMPWGLAVHAGGCSLLFSMVGAMAGVAITSEVLGLIPAANKSLSTAVNMSLLNLAIALSQLFIARSISWNILAPEWKMLGQEYSVYDTVLLVFGILILLMLVTIGLVPKIAKKAQLLPGSTFPR
jgi:MFS family permease